MLKDKKVKELREIAEIFGVDHSESKTKVALLAQLAEEGVTDRSYQEYVDATEIPEKEDILQGFSEPAPTKPVYGKESQVALVKMNRANPTYEIHGFKFTRDHPYVAMSMDEAQEIFDHDPRGFTLATPRELEEYYS